MRLSSKLKLRHLEIFVEVARKKSVTAAAEALNMTQPGVTRTIRELEQVCQKPLVEKHGRGIRLSPYGEVFLDYAGLSLAQARDGVRALTELDEGQGAPVEIGALPTVSATIVPDTIARLLASGARSRFTVITGDNQHLLDQLRRGNLDLVVGRLPAPESMLGLTFDPLFRDRVVAVTAADHPLANALHINQEDLEQFPVLMPSKGSIIRPMVDRLMLEQGLSAPQATIETVSDSFGRSYTRRYQAIWIISQGVVTPDLEDGSFKKLAIDTSSTAGPVGLCIRREHRLSPSAQQFANTLRLVIDEMVPPA